MNNEKENSKSGKEGRIIVLRKQTTTNDDGEISVHIIIRDVSDTLKFRWQ